MKLTIILAVSAVCAFFAISFFFSQYEREECTRWKAEHQRVWTTWQVVQCYAVK